MGKNIITQRRGRGTTSFRAPSFKFKGTAKVPNKDDLTGVVVDILKCPAHTAPLMRIEYASGDLGLSIAPEGIAVGDLVEVGTTEVKQGYVVRLKDLPEGTLVHNVELVPGDGGKLIRSSGTFGRVSVRTPKGITIILPSKKTKVFNENCRATIGVVAGGNRVDKPMLKAGNMHYKQKARNHLYPVVSGSAMNAVSHPFGNKRTSRKSKNRPIPRNAPPGRKVGNVAARRTGQRRG
ncbi:MAG: 50S ribosomal protein L2 [Candidatus Woesearchaeota archaeon]